MAVSARRRRQLQVSHPRSDACDSNLPGRARVITQSGTARRADEDVPAMRRSETVAR
jgi:hypothetical protein